MRIRPVLIFSLLFFSGCHQSGANLRIEPFSKETASSADVAAIKTSGAVEQPISNNVKVVTGEPAIVGDEKDETAEAPKDKPGAVAVKMEY